jgi:hypothetical protein
MLRTVRDKRYPIAFIVERTYLTPGFTAEEEGRSTGWSERSICRRR